MVRRTLALALGAVAWLAGTAHAQPENWSAILEKARGQTVFFNAWGGDDRINTYVAWAGEQVKTRFGVTVQQVKLTDTAEAVARVLAEKSAGRSVGGSVDLIWINGENFAAMKRNGLLQPSWTHVLPNYRFVDTEGKPTTLFDFTIPVEGQEAPWGMAQVVFMYDTAQVREPPRTMVALSAWAKANPGRLTYPQPPNFLGTTFLKQALIELAVDPKRLAEPAGEDAEKVLAPLWPYLDQLHPVLWRGGRAFPANGPQQRRLMGDNEVDIAISFNPSEASSAIANKELPDTVRTFVLEGGTIGNTSFVAIPFNAKAREGAMVLADFLLSPEAQARKQDPRVWGGPTVLALDKLMAADRQRFVDLPLGVATLPPDRLGRVLPEPHPTWVERLEKEWQRRYATR
ncbi:MAG: ABC transporter substrate-binding protein [Alphaproteobacteria bacterium]|nr:ABC transporter substrate-binding protein [Alphaproteobacteria bacterium]